MSVFPNKKTPDYLKDKELCTTFLELFADVQTQEKTYYEQVKQIAQHKRKLIEIKLDDVATFFSNLELVYRIEGNTKTYEEIWKQSIDTLIEKEFAQINEEAQDGYMSQLRSSGKADQIPKDLLRRHEVSFIERDVRPPIPLRKLKSEHIGKLVSVRGTVTRVSDVKAEIRVVCYMCTCGAQIFQEVAGKTYTPITRCVSAACKTNGYKGVLEQLSRGCRFVKFQELRLQEKSDEVPDGNIPRSLRVYIAGDLTRKCSPGDSVTVSGIFMPAPKQSQNGRQIHSAVATTYLQAMKILRHKKRYDDYSEDASLLDEIKKDQKEKKTYDLLAASIAPEIYGHDDVKKSLLLMLSGGVTKLLGDGVKIRGDINICLMGDPGVAKSQLLRYIAQLSPRGIYTTGKGSSGVGLTAAVVKDQMTNELILEGGALVLADKGICCIDEFDKMDEYDRTALHEVMEQQSVSIAKAGITTTLNARASVLAAANPAYGRYNPRKSPTENINLPPALLSRFDLMFLILDKQNDDLDLALAKHITYVHQHSKAPDAVGANQFFDKNYIRGYISLAKSYNPAIPASLTDFITELYVKMRENDHRFGSTAGKEDYSDPSKSYTTPRALLSILRLAQAHARLRFSNEVIREDILEAQRLMESSKASLLDETTTTTVEPVSQIFTILSSRRANQVSTGRPNPDDVLLSDVIGELTAKGLVPHLDKCLEEYEGLNIWSVITVNNQANAVTFI